METANLIMEEIEQIKKKIVPVLKKFNVTKAGIFGSYARGEQKKRSDVDILIELDNSADLFDLIRLQANLEKEVKRKVDLVEYSLIRQEIRENILNDEVQIL